MKRFKLYLIGYNPPELPMTEEVASELIHQCDSCLLVSEPPPIGEKFEVTSTIFFGDGGGPGIGKLCRVVRHEHQGKVIVVEEVELS